MSLTAPLAPSAAPVADGVSEWIVPYAASPADDASDEAVARWRALQLPHLQQLLARLTPQPPLPGSELDLSPPHERALARALQLPDAPGRIPWAAALLPAETAADDAWAYITPGHWRIGADQVHQGDPAQTPLSEAESRELLALLAPWFAEDGMELVYEQPQRWIARGAIFEHLATASLDRVIGRDVRPWLPDTQQARTLHRLQSEVQMLLYTHAFNDARAARGQPPINAFWVHGTGRRPAGWTAAAAPAICVQDLRAAALHGDWPAWSTAWQALDAGLLTRLLARAQAGQPTTLTLCGERHAMQWRLRPLGWTQKIKQLVGPKRLPDLPMML